jgi:hypothetical protein
VIKIRYSDLPGGLHLSADVRGNHTILFLLPGLTAAQRKAAIRRARSAARVGHGPVLPALGLARAVAADRIATTVRNGLAAMRMHPAVFLPPMIMVLSAAIAYVLLVSVSIRLYPPQAAGKSPVLGAASPGAVHPAGGRRPGSQPASGSVPGRSGSPAPGSPSPGPSSHRPPGSPSPGASASPSPDPSSHRPPGSPEPSPSPSSLPSPSPSPSATPGSAGGGGVCVKVGPLGVCLNV